MESGERKSSFIKKYKVWFITLVALLIIIYIIVYLCFRWEGFIPAGIALEKKDWLSFLGAYFAFAGTIVVSTVATLQAKYFSEQEKNRAYIFRKKEIQPIFSIKIEGTDLSVLGTAEAISLYGSFECKEHKNVLISIQNVSNYPILNVIIFDKYMFPLLKPNEIKRFQIAYSDSPDIRKWESLIVQIRESEYERDDKGIPKRFNINYDDIDGNKMFQAFELTIFKDTNYYSLEATYDV